MKNVIKIVCLSILAVPMIWAMDTHLDQQLLAAALHGNPTLVQQLIDAKANINTTDVFGQGYNALMYATLQDHFPCVQALITAKANINNASREGFTALILAGPRQDLRIAQALIAAKANLNHRTNFGFTALQQAAYDGHQNACEVLFEALLKLPNKSQKKSIFAVLTCGAKRKGFFKKYMVPKEITQQIAKYMLEACEQANRTNYTDSVVYDELSKIWNRPIEKALLEKNNLPKSQCEIQ